MSNHDVCALSAQVCSLAEERPSKPTLPDFPRVRAGTQLESLFANPQAEGGGYGIRNPDASGLPVATVFFDTQCPWGSRLWQAVQPFLDQIDFIFYPVAVLRCASIGQGSALLAAETPWAALKQHFETFDSEKPHNGGIEPAGIELPEEYREQVWVNSRTFRRAGGTEVPLGVFLNDAGRYLPIVQGNTTEELAEVFKHVAVADLTDLNRLL